MDFKRNFIPTAVLISMCLFLSCADTDHQSANHTPGIFSSSSLQVDNLQRNLNASFDSNQHFFERQGDTLKKFKSFQRLYAENKFNPIWFNENGPNDLAMSYIDGLDSLRYDGLDLQAFYLDELKSIVANASNKTWTDDEAFQKEILMTKSFFALSEAMVLGQMPDSNKEWKVKNDTLFDEVAILQATCKLDNIHEAFNNMRPSHPWYFKFRNEYIRLSKSSSIVEFGNLEVWKDSIKDGDSLPGIVLLRRRLNAEVNLPVDTISSTWNPDLSEGIKKYQHLHQLKQSGMLDSATAKMLSQSSAEKLATLSINMDRMRKMKHDFIQPYIWVVVPKMELDYVENNQVGFNMRVVVGRTSRPTPSLVAKIENIVLSPPWTVPPTIMKEEVVPGIARRGGSYLARRGLKAYDRRGRVVNASMINASNYKKFSIGQAPGYRSSLGEVKFNMINPWAIYMHDTPHREDFVKSYRASSSGCVRVQKPKEFAAFLLRDTAKYSYHKIDSICKLRKTIFIPMDRKIDVHVVYLTNAIDSAGNVMYLKDIYGWDKKMKSVSFTKN